ncbi:MAG: hypothetical protein ACOY4U_01685 [Pseudomonadota bacterium]
MTLCRLLSCLILLSLSMVAPAQAAAAASKWRPLTTADTVGMFVMNDIGEFFFVTCPDKDDACQYSVVLGVDCDERRMTPALLSTDRGTELLNLRCTAAGERTVPAIADKNPERLLSGVDHVGVALGSGPGEFLVAKFTVTGFDAALADLQKRHAARRAAARP